MGGWDAATDECLLLGDGTKYPCRLARPARPRGRRPYRGPDAASESVRWEPPPRSRCHFRRRSCGTSKWATMFMLNWK